MQTTTIIKVPAGTLYLSELMDTLPEGIFNKKHTGAGATHQILINKENVIVSVPIKELIFNKTSQLPGLFGIYGSVTKLQFIEYINNTILNDQPIKIIVTYDSLLKVTGWLEELDLLSVMYLVVDEYQQLLLDFGYRSPAIDNLLFAVNSYRKITYLSATPIKPEYAPKQFENLPYTELEWEESVNIKPLRYKTTKPFVAAANLIKNHLSNNNQTEINGKIAKELYIFLNSVTAIADLIEECGLTNSKVKVICSDNTENRNILQLTKISKALDENKPITLITSKAFVGCDFYSESGLTVVISNVNARHTLQDIATEIFQIAGRIRNKENPFKNTLVHIYNTGCNDIDEVEFEKSIEIKTADTYYRINQFNTGDDLTKKLMLKKRLLYPGLDYTYYNRETNQLEFNDLGIKNERFKRNISMHIYKNGVSVRKAYSEAGFDVSNSQQYIEIEGEWISNAVRRSFEQIAIQYVDDLSQNKNVEQLELENPLLKQVKNVLGLEAFSAMDYNQKKLQAKLFNESNEAKNLIYNQITKAFQSGEFYSSKFIKEVLTEIFTKNEITKSTKASTLGDYLDITEIKKKIDGKVIAGYIIKY